VETAWTAAEHAWGGEAPISSSSSPSRI